MIPKVIHYCWFGGNPKSQLLLDCIESWKKFCPDYEIIEWNESNFDVAMIPYTSDAYKAKKWAFVSDFARLWIVYNYGGIYLDTDVKLSNSNIDELLQYECWLASDDVRYVATGLGFGAEKGNKLIGAMMEAYKSYVFPSATNVIRDTKVVERELASWNKSDKSQVIENVMIVGMNDYGKYARHLYTYTWADKEIYEKRQNEIAKREDFRSKNGQNPWNVRLMWKIKCWARKPEFIAHFDKIKGTKREKIYTFCAYDLLDCGPWYYIKRLFKKIFKRKG